MKYIFEIAWRINVFISLTTLEMGMLYLIAPEKLYSLSWVSLLITCLWLIPALWKPIQEWKEENDLDEYLNSFPNKKGKNETKRKL